MEHQIDSELLSVHEFKINLKKQLVIHILLSQFS